MFNSSHLNIITPEKVCLGVRHLTPLKAKKGRFQPSSHVKSMVGQVNRIHAYQFHEPVKFIMLSDLNFSSKSVKTISDHLKSFDKPNIILKFEELAIQSQFYDAEVREYMAEEFDVELDFSFPIIAVLTYQKILGVGLEDALTELFSLSVLSTVCEKCVTGVENTKDKMKSIDFYNAALLKDINGNTLTESDTDSFVDPQYSVPNDTSTSTDFCSNSDYELTQPKGTSVLSQDQTGESGYVFNPFLEDSSNESTEASVVIDFKPKMSSTFQYDYSSPKDSLMKRKSLVACKLCGKTFSNSYNMKLHQIR